LIGSSLSLFLVVLLQPWIAEEFGLYLGGSIITLKETFILGTTFIGGFLIGLLPALRAQRTALKDGLSVKV
jgi:putative ABC transport system permease protein